jgi:poly(beta-D-mannuronate) lyase
MLNRPSCKLSYWLFAALFATSCSGAARAPGGAGGEGGEGGSETGGTGGSAATGGKAGGTGGSATGGLGGSPSETGGASGGGGAGNSGGAGSGGSGGGGAGMGGAGGEVQPPPESGEPPLPACKNTVQVANSGALGGAISAAKAGDCLVLADGDYPAPTIALKGTAEAPIVLRAANKLKVNMNGVVKLDNSSYVVLEGFTFPGASGTSIGGTADHVRVTRSRYFSGSAKFDGTAKDNRVDHCEFGPKNTDGNLAQPTGLSTNTRIDHNYFHDVSAGGGNGRETIRLGCCGEMFDLHETGNIVEHNLLVNCSGEAEIISIKASRNTVRYNTIRNSAGNLTLRAGKNNSIHGNFVFGTGNQGGLRVFDSGHKIWNNYVQTGSALIGNRSGPIHAALTNAIIVNNTFIGSVTLAGSGNVFANNITSAAPTLGGAMSTGNLSATDAGLMKVGEVMAITATSKAVDASMGSYEFVMDDVNGQPRNKPDVGADEWSMAPSLYGPLTVKDVGPDSP